MVGLAALLAAGPERLATATTPLAEAVQAVGAGAQVPVVRIAVTSGEVSTIYAGIAIAR